MNCFPECRLHSFGEFIGVNERVLKMHFLGYRPPKKIAGGGEGLTNVHLRNFPLPHILCTYDNYCNLKKLILPKESF